MNVNLNTNNVNVSEVDNLSLDNTVSNSTDKVNLQSVKANENFSFNDKAQLTAPTMTPNQNGVSSNCDEMLDSIYKVMGELQKLMAKQREQNSETIVNNLQMAKNENIAAADKIKDSATTAFVLQMVGAGLSIVGSVVSLGMNIKAFSSQAGALSQAKNLDEFKNGTLSLDNALKTVTTNSDKLTAYAKVVDSINNTTKGIFDSIANYTSTIGQSESKKCEAKAQEIQATIEKLKEVTEGIKDVQRKALETMASVSQNEVEVIRKLSV